MTSSEESRVPSLFSETTAENMETGGYTATMGVEPIAIIGMSCRLPGSAQDPSSLWEMLVSGRSAWTPGPGKRFNMKAFQDPSRRKSDTTNASGGHFLKDDIAGFDANFFAINPIEAKAMDPQQRLLLEIAYESFQNAGLSTESLYGSNTGVFVGQWTSDYHEIQVRDINAPPLYLTTGTGPAISSNRISYNFNLRGPSLTIDTGCSSGLVALHQAVCSLRNGETSMCFVGSANLLLDPQRFVYQSKMNMLSDDGRSFAFDNRANGYGRGEGLAGIMLKPLSTALRDGNHVRAVIRNTVLNQDGKTPGITVPNESAQESAIIQAYKQANLEPYADYVEAHGTGTKVGDPKEASAIAAALTRSMTSDCSIPIGSIKSNIGHTEATSGLAGLIKAVLMLEHGAIPPQASFEIANPDVRLKEWKLRIPTKLEKRQLKRISLNNFGYGGTNAHVVVDAAPPLLPSSSPSVHLDEHSSNKSHLVFFISAASAKSCQRICSRLAKYLICKHRGSHSTNMTLARLAHSLSLETINDYRLAIVASGLDDLVYQLNQAAGSPISRRSKRQRSRVAFVFSGQGAQYARMGCDLLNSHAAFARSMERASKHLKNLGSPWDLLEELGRPHDESRINEPAISQPTSTAIQLSLVDLMADYGLLPCAVLGHSSGEMAAAYAAGVIPFEDAMTASYLRGKLAGEAVLANSKSAGAMLAVGADPDTVHLRIENIARGPGRMRIACFNSPSSVTVSGDAAAVEELQSVLEREAIFNRKLFTNGVAYHSHQMEIMGETYAEALKEMLSSKDTPCSGVRVFSSVTGKETAGRIMADSHYWVDNLLKPVLFSQALQEMAGANYGGEPLDVVLEVGPHGQLRGPVQQTLKSLQSGTSLGFNASYAATLNRGKNAEMSLLECLGELKVAGVEVSLDQINGLSKGNRPTPLVDLPPYPFDHDQTFWHETRVSRTYRHRKHVPHELLGSLVPDAGGAEPRWRHFLSLQELPWLRSHVIQGQVVFPAAGFITMAAQAVRQHLHAASPSGQPKSLLFRNISISQALILPKDGPDVELVLSLRQETRTARESSKAWSEFRIYSVTPDDLWNEHCRGLVHAEADSLSGHDAPPSAQDLARIRARCNHEATPKKLYHLGREIGIDWQHPFDNVLSLRTCKDACVITARKSAGDVDPGGVGDILHPTLLDSCLFQGLCAVNLMERGETSTFIPYFIEQLRIFNKPCKHDSELTSSSVLCQDASGYDVFVRDGADSDHCMILAAQGVRTKTVPGDTGLSHVPKDICHSQVWVPYVDAWTRSHRDDVCKAKVSPGSALEENRILDSLTLYYVQRALKEVAHTDIPDGHRRHFFEWMTALADPSLPASPLPQVPPGLLTHSLIQGVLRLGPELHRILTNEIDPLTLLTPDNLLGRMYDSERAARCISQMAEYCHELARQKTKLRVLEVGAGTASATLPILEALNSRGYHFTSKYDFTDVSPGFFSPARERLGSLTNVVDFGILDIERNPVEQGFEAASYDLIIASNVIHATRSIGTALSNIRTLLKPGGKFLLMELTQAKPHYNLLFGVFEGWWAGHKEGRSSSPLLVRSQWISRLSLAGFSDPEFWFEDYPEQNGGTISVFGASALGDEVLHELPPVHIVTTAVDKYGPLSHKCEIPPNLAFGRSNGPITFTFSSVSSVSPGENIAIILPDVATMLCNQLPEESWQNFKQWILMAKAVLLVSCASTDPDGMSSGIWPGFARCVREEYPNIQLITLDLNAHDDMMLEKLLAVLPAVLGSMSRTIDILEREDEFAESHGQLFVSRIISDEHFSDYIHRIRHRAEPEMQPFLNGDRTLIAELAAPGLLESLRWKDDTDAPCLEPDEVKLELRAASINFKDVLIAAGQLEGLTQMRNDCSGIVIEVGANMRERFRVGDRVCALYSRSYTNYPIVHGDCCQVVPDNMSWEEAAALPVVGTTVYHALMDAGRLVKGDSILIHSSAGAVGQAAIMLAQHVGATVFVTVGNDNKRDLLHQRYGVPREHIFSSRTPEFFNGIKRLTSGYGVDVVLNSLGGEMFRHSCNLVAPFGRFVEIGRKDLMDDAHMALGFLLKNITFSYVDMALIMDKRKPRARKLLQTVVNLAATGVIAPVSLSTLPISEIETAFRQVQSGKHTGKIILRVEDNQKVKATPSRPVQAKLDHNASYVVVGGLGGLGRAIVRWMAAHEAKHIVSLSRSGENGKQGQSFIKEMEGLGVVVVATKCDVASLDAVVSFREAHAHAGRPPIRGIVHSAMVARDAPFENMTFEDWRCSLGPKVAGTLNLHRSFGAEIDFFIVMSSGVAVRGSAGLANYAAGCSFQDALVRQRIAAGMPSFSINAGAVLEEGFVSENPVAAAVLRRHGLGSVRVLDILAMLNSAVTRECSHEQAGFVRSIGMLPSNVQDYLPLPRRFAYLAQQEISEGIKEESGDRLALLPTAARSSDAIDIIRSAILQQLSKLIAIPVDSLDSARKLDSYGVDSLVAVELRNWIGVHLQANLQLMALRGTSSIDELVRVICKESRLVNLDM